MKILFLILIVTNIYSFSLEDDWKSMSPKERRTIYKSFVTGSKYDLGLTLAAICWQESKGGRWQICTNYDGFGLYHISIYWYLKELKIKDTIFNKSEYATILLTQPEVSERFVIKKLQNLYATYGDYKTVWWKYNGSKKYSELILAKVKFLKIKFKK